MDTAIDLSAEAFESLSKQLEQYTKQWSKAAQHAQLNRCTDSSIMDMYDTSIAKGMNVFLSCELHVVDWHPHLVWMYRKGSFQRKGKMHLPMVRHLG